MEPGGNERRKIRRRDLADFQRREEERIKLALKKLEEIVQKYGLKKTMGKTIGDFSLSNRLHGQRWEEIVVGREESHEIREHADLIVTLRNPEAFEALIRDEGVQDLYTPTEGRLRAREKVNYPYWFIVNAPSEDGKLVGKIRVVSDSTLTAPGFFGNVVYPSFLGQRSIDPTVKKLFEYDPDQLLEIEKARDLVHLDPVEGVETTRIRLESQRKTRYFRRSLK